MTLEQAVITPVMPAMEKKANLSHYEKTKVLVSDRV